MAESMREIGYTAVIISPYRSQVNELMRILDKHQN